MTDSLLQEINMLPGILGCFVCNNKQQITGNKMPPIFNEKAIQSIANQLFRTVQMGQAADFNIADIEIKHNESVILAYTLSGGALLIIICEPLFNKPLVSMTVNMLSKDITSSMATEPMRSTPDKLKQTIAVKDTESAPPAEPIKIDAKLATILKQMKDALALAMGPIAGPIMKDSIKIWARQTPPSRKRLSALAKIICKEINDTDLAKTFMSELTKIKL